MYELQVEGMSCQHCVSVITKSVQDVDHGAKVDVDLGSKKVRVVSELPVERFESAIQEAGYDVSAARIA
ncbi:copper chaperone [Oxalobacteraceae bacterium OM1]|nr:copper chaperone [Oxalobacteraceae bacterium OM1]